MRLRFGEKVLTLFSRSPCGQDGSIDGIEDRRRGRSLDDVLAVLEGALG
jgi:hypothetical protein